MIDDPENIARRIAYIDTIRALHKQKRAAGFAACLIGVLLMAAGRFMEGAPQWLTWAGLAVVITGWLLFAYVVFSRVAWSRAHPFEPSA